MPHRRDCGSLHAGRYSCAHRRGRRHAQGHQVRARDAGLKFAFENHAGDTRSEEVLDLIHAAGTDFCGVMLDPGNALWAMEDPMEQLQKLGKHVFCTSVRDYTAWVSAEGATFQWTAIGEGLMDVPAYMKRFKELCPGVPFFVETISNEARPIPFLTDEFMAGFPDLKVADITPFLKLCRRGRPPQILKRPPAPPRRNSTSNCRRRSSRRASPRSAPTFSATRTTP
ncbi:MAG: sugar phosphate isomerase/epimerase [Verrucomicrobiae bacterium]|nr:sugar phosphate isomerase/epimerase [Verrucomicrobiae bacterium]